MQKPMYILIITALLMPLLSSCTQTGSALLNSLAKTNEYSQTANIRYGSDAQNTLDIYHPNLSNTQDKKQLRPVLVFIYGGCWGECSDLRKADYRFVAQPFAAQGFITVIPNFRQYPAVNFTNIMQDTAQAMRWVSQHIAEYGGDSKRLVIAGHSSGAHIASMLALSPDYLDPNIRQSLRGFIGLAGPYDFLPFKEDYQRKLFAPPERYAQSQTVNIIAPQSPPILLLHGEKDTTVKIQNSISLAQKARSKGVQQQLIRYPQHSHTSLLLALSRPLQNRSPVLQDMLKFMRQQTSN